MPRTLCERCERGTQVADTYDVDAARRSYYGQLFPLNPSGVVPSGPTARDLRLGENPGRGGHAPSDVFHMLDAAVSAASAA